MFSSRGIRMLHIDGISLDLYYFYLLAHAHMKLFSLVICDGIYGKIDGFGSQFNSIEQG